MSKYIQKIDLDKSTIDNLIAIHALMLMGESHGPEDLENCKIDWCIQDNVVLSVVCKKTTTITEDQQDGSGDSYRLDGSGDKIY